MPTLMSPRFFGEEVLESCLSGHRIFAGSGDPPESVATLQQALVDLGFNISVDGIFGTQTGTAVSTYKTRKGLSPADPVVGAGTMRALDADFAHELFDAKAAALAGGPFDLGLRIGTRIDHSNGFATCRFENGIVIEIGHARAFALPAVFEAAWSAAGGVDGTFGIPTSDPFVLDSSRIAQEFAFVTHIIDGLRELTLPTAVWEASIAGASLIGVPLEPPTPIGEGGANFVQHERGVVLSVPGASPQPLPQPVFDFWSAQEAAGASLGPPTAFAFPSGTDIVFQFHFGSIVLSDLGVASLAGPVSENLSRYFQPQNDSQFLLGPISGTVATPIIGTPLIGSTDVFKRMRTDIASATGAADFVYILSWHCNIDLELVPGDATSKLRELLTGCIGAGAQVRLMLWAGDPVPHPPIPLTKFDLVKSGTWEFVKQITKTKTSRPINEPAVQFVNGKAGTGDAAAILDDRHLPFGSHHQKVVVIRAGAKLVAYVGGNEPNEDRLKFVAAEPGSPLFDISVRLEDAGAWLVLQSFINRWDLHPDRTGPPLLGGSLPRPAHIGPLAVQVTHTYGRGFPFSSAVQTAATALANGIKSAQQFFYIEDQYCVGSAKMRAAIQDVMSGSPNVVAIFVIAAENSVIDTPDLPFRRREFFRHLVRTIPPGRVLVFERLGGGSTIGPTAYLHSKLLIVDDEAAFIGSVNSNRRSWFHDSEIDVTIVDTTGTGGTAPGTRGWVRDFRSELWSKHFNIPSALLGDFATCLAVWQAVISGQLVFIGGNLVDISGIVSVRPYNIFTVPPRPSIKGVQAPDSLLDDAWDGYIDPS